MFESFGEDACFLGHEHNKKRLNVQKELRSLSKDPLSSFLASIANKDIFRNPIARYEETYRLYFYCVERVFSSLSLTYRCESFRSKATQKLTGSQKALIQKWRDQMCYFQLDFFSSLLYARILMDQTAGLARIFLNDANEVPSFTSFNGHKKFFKKRKMPFGKHEAYAEYICTKTDWFDFPLKAVRDKFIVHQGPRHMQFFGFPAGDTTDLCLVYTVPDNPKNDLSRVRMINVSIVALSREIEQFLTWFAGYALSTLEETK